MDKLEFELMLQEFLYSMGSIEIKIVETFTEAQVLTNDKGLVVVLENGDKFHLTIKKVN